MPGVSRGGGPSFQTPRSVALVIGGVPRQDFPDILAVLSDPHMGSFVVIGRQVAYLLLHETGEGIKAISGIIRWKPAGQTRPVS